MTTEIAMNTPAEVATAYGKSCRFERYLIAGSADHNGYRYENIIPWNTTESVWISQESVIRAEHIELAEQGHIRSIVVNPPPPRRLLSSLTEGEINTCYKQAMGVDYDVDRIERSDTNSSITAYVGKDYLSLDEIAGHVRVSATIFFDGWEYPAMMRMAPLVRYLDSIGIDLG